MFSLAHALMAVLPIAGVWRQQPNPRFASRSCHVAFGYPSDWEVVNDTTEPGAKCAFRVRPRDWRQRLAGDDSVDVCSITVRVTARGVWREAADAGFQRRGAGWIVSGREGSKQPADTTRGIGWRGVRGMASVGCYGRTGTYAGLCDQPMAVAGTAKRSVILVAGPRAEDVFDRILATLRISDP